jgi:hypothetical protein
LATLLSDVRHYSISFLDAFEAGYLSGGQRQIANKVSLVQ